MQVISVGREWANVLQHATLLPYLRVNCNIRFEIGNFVHHNWHVHLPTGFPRRRFSYQICFVHFYQPWLFSGTFNKFLLL